MKRILLITVLMAAGLLQSTAQKTSYGITGGISKGSVRISGFDNRFTGIVQGDNIFGIEGGFFAKIKVNPFYVKPAAMILYKNGTVDVFNTEGEAHSQSNFKMSKLEVPLLFGINVIGPVDAEIGPVYDYVLGVTNEFNGYTTDVPRNGLGYRAGVNVELGRLALGISYQAITNRSGSQGTFDSPDELILGAAFTFASKPGMAPYGR